MDSIFGPIIFQPIGWFFNKLFELCGNVAPAIFLLTLTIDILMFPLQVRQQRSTAKQTALKPKLEKLREKYGNDRVKLQQETQALYAKENVSMTGGCLTSFIRLPFIWAIWRVIAKPFTYMAGAFNTPVKQAVAKLIEGSKDSYAELKLVGSDNLPAALDIFDRADFELFGLDLLSIPSIKSPALNWIFPAFAFATAMLSSVVMMKLNRRNASTAEAQQQQSMGCMMYGMPFITLIFSFSSIPAAISSYWGFSNILSMLIQIIVVHKFGPYTAIAQGYAKTVKQQQQKEAKKLSAPSEN